MIRKYYRGFASMAVLLALTAVAGWSTESAATPNPNSAVFNLRVFNDCGTSTVTTNNTYPSDVWIDDFGTCTTGFANLHAWSFSEDGTNAAVFNNADCFSFSATLILTGTGNGEAATRISPWWSQNVDGRINVRLPDGEIACFGGRLPFFSFTGNYGIIYVRGTPIRLEMHYDPNSLSSSDPATVEYRVTYNSVTYSSGNLPFDMGNPAEDPPYGLWGMLNDARVGGLVQPFVGTSGPNLRATFLDIVYTACPPTSTEPTSWGKVKGLFQ